MTDVQPGDVILVRTGSVAGAAIRLGAALLGRANLQNHVAIAHHVDEAGRLWVLEGRPGGVGWRDARAYLASPWTVNNAGQPKAAGQRAQICELAKGMLGEKYDWSAVIADAMQAARIPDLWRRDWNGHAPGAVVCSSFAAYLYGKAGLDRPAPSAGGRYVEPADWTDFIIQNRYNVTPAGS